MTLEDGSSFIPLLQDEGAWRSGRGLPREPVPSQGKLSGESLEPAGQNKPGPCGVSLRDRSPEGAVWEARMQPGDPPCSPPPHLDARHSPQAAREPQSPVSHV